MINFAEIIGVDKTITLDSSNGDGAPETIPSGGFVNDRVSDEELELTYRFDPFVFNSINRQAQAIMAAGLNISSPTKKVRNFYIEFLAKVDDVDDSGTFDDMLFSTYLNLMKYGKNFWEIVFNKKMTKVVDLRSLNPQRVDYARDTRKNMVLDDKGKPVGYIYSLEQGTNTEGLGDKVPEKVSKSSNQIFLIPARIVHFKLFKFGDGFESVGYIEPGYKSIIRKHKIQEAQADSIYARGTAPIIDKVGSSDHYPTNDMIKQATKNLSQMKHNKYFAVPYWHEIKALEIKTPDMIDTTSKELKEEILASLGGMPLALATGAGEATNRSTLSTQQKFLEYSLRDMVRRVSTTIRKQLFVKISKLEDFNEVPKIVWGDIDVEGKDQKASRLVEYSKSEILTPEEIRPYAIESEQLDIYEQKESNNKIKKLNKDYSEEEVTNIFNKYF